MAENGNTLSADAEAVADSVSDGVVAARDRFQRLSEDVRGKYADVSDEVRRGAERASKQIRREAERASKEIRRGAERARDTYNDVADNARRRYGKLREDAGGVSRDVGFYVRDNPGKSLLIAAGVGFLLGLVVRGRNSDDI